MKSRSLFITNSQTIVRGQRLTLGISLPDWPRLVTLLHESLLRGYGQTYTFWHFPIQSQGNDSRQPRGCFRREYDSGRLAATKFRCLGQRFLMDRRAIFILCQ